jgi:uncharacterized protein (TIGR02246 family)
MAESRNETIEDCLNRIRTAWNAGDATAFASEFTEDATYVIYSGIPLVGRAEIERMHVHPLGRGTRMKLKVLSERAVMDGVTVVLTIGGVGEGAVIPYDKVQTLTLVRQGNRWMCTAFQNTEMSPADKRLHNPDIEL